MLSAFCERFLSSNGFAEDIMIDVMAKRVSTSKRQILYLFYIIHRYLKIREGAYGNPESQQVVGKVLYIASGRAPHSHLEGKKIIEAVYKLMRLLNNDPATQDTMKVLFVPNFNVALCEMYVSAADLS